MVNPQVENGYIRIAIAIYEALSRIRISGEARQVLDVVIRKTYGYQKKEDIISLSQFALSTGLKQPTVAKAMRKLLSMNLITKKDNGKVGLQKNFDLWKPLPKKITLPKKIIGLTKKDNKSLPKKVHTKDIYTNTKDTITKDIHIRGQHPDEAKTPLLKVLKAYRLKRFPEIQGLAERARIEEIGRWNRHNIPKLSKYAKELIDYLGNWQDAVTCIDELGTEFDKNPNIADWSLSAISKNASRWKLKQRQGEFDQ